MITYLLQLTLCWGIFYVAYHIFLRHETHFKYNRLYLLLALGLGLILPLIDWSILISNHPESLSDIYITPLNTQMTEWDITVQAAPRLFNWYLVLTVVYVLGFLAAGVKLIRGWLGILSIRRQSELSQQNGYTLVLTPLNHMPFSFLNSVYCSRQFYTESSDIDQILAHEAFHIKAFHSMDIILLEIFKVVFWFHPFVYLYKRELQQIHEYQADYAAYHLSSKKEYGKLLLTQAQSGMPVALANYFFNTQLKNRFKMMTKKPSTRQAMLKYLVMLPMVAMAVLLFSYTGQGKPLSVITYLQQDTMIPPPPPPVFLRPPPPPPYQPLPAIGEVMTVGAEEYEVKKTDLLYVDGRKVGYLTQELIDKYGPEGPWVFEVFTKSVAKERIDPGIETNVYSIRKKIPTLDEVNKELNPESKKSNEIFRVVEEMPRFPGCDDLSGDRQEKKACADQKMLEFIYANVRYPAEARNKGVEGNVVLTFIVEMDGSITELKAVRDPGSGLGEEAIRVVSMMNDLPEKWTPGRQRGQNVRVQFVLPVKFELSSPKKDLSEVIVTGYKSSPSESVKIMEDSQQRAPMSDALLVIDDVIMGAVNSSELIKSVDPQDIESISVLKGESAKEKYGQKGVNGVVEIFTKWRNSKDSPQLKMTNINVYPVPARDMLYIEAGVPAAGEYTLDIRDLKGSVVRGQAVPVDDGVLRSEINLSGLSAGPYFLLISQNGKVFSRTFIKQ